MLHLDLTEEEAAALFALLQYQLPEQRMEIADTDDEDFKKQLKEKEALLEAVQDKLANLQS